MYADDDSKTRLTGTLKPDGATPPCNGGLTPGKNQQQADDDMNWLHGLNKASQVYIPNFKTFINPSTRNDVDPNNWADTLIDNLDCNGPVTVRLYADLSNKAVSRTSTAGHSYEVFGCWHNQADGYPRKTAKTVLTYRHTKPGPFQDQCTGPSMTWVIQDSLEPHKDHDYTYENYPNDWDSHGRDGAHVSCADGHAEWIQRLQWNYRYEMSEDAGRQTTPYY